VKYLIVVSLAALAACGPPASEPVEEESSGEEQAPPAEETEPSGGQTCGGIAALRCPAEHWCDIDASHPDASGACRPNGQCDAAADCERQELVHAMCVGAWACNAGACAWECE
jgi:hypothetical protein